MVIDFHTHAFPDKIAPRAIKSLAEKAGGLPYYTDGTVSDMDEKMRSWGVDKRVMLSIATNPKQQHNVNSFAIAQNSAHIIAFGSVHPDAPDALDELDRIKGAGLLGVKFHPEYQEFYIDDPKLYPIYDKCRALGLVMSFHAGCDLGFPDSLMAPPQRSRKLIDNFPGAKIVLAHMGGAMLDDDVLTYIAGTDCYLDTSFSIHDLPKRAAEQIIEKHGAERILFGSDCPWERSCDSFDYIDSLSISDDKKELIYSTNAITLLGLNK